MTRKRFSAEQIVGVLKQVEVGITVVNVSQNAFFRNFALYQGPCCTNEVGLRQARHALWHCDIDKQVPEPCRTSRRVVVRF